MSANPSKPSITTKAALVSNNQLLFWGLQTVLSHVTSLTMTPSSDGFDKAIQQTQPQLIILDMESYINATEMIRKVKDAVPHAKILLMAGFNGIEGTRQALLSGADGVVLMIQPPEVLFAAVTVLIQPPPKAGAVTANGHALSKPHIPVWATQLAPRERDIVECVSQGLSNKEVADRLSITGITVRHHLTSIFSKLGVAGRQKLIIQAHHEGMVQPIPSDTTRKRS